MLGREGVGGVPGLGPLRPKQRGACTVCCTESGELTGGLVRGAAGTMGCVKAAESGAQRG